jgi:hypothetical protein
MNLVTAIYHNDIGAAGTADNVKSTAARGWPRGGVRTVL